MGKSQRVKGANGERELCDLLFDHLGVRVRRNLGQARDSGHDVTVPPFNIEVKRRQRIGNLYEWLAQADQGAPDPRAMPCVALRADGAGWLVVMRFEDWTRLAREEIAQCRTP